MAATLACALAGLPAAPAEAAGERFRSLGAGGWCWFADPRGVHHRGRFRRTYVGWVDRRGDIRVASYDHASRVRTTVVLHRRLGIDDHNNPSLHVRPDGRLMVFYAEHNGPKMYYRTSSARRT